ncbi:hypothetical protein BC826DRAFT_1189330 [Russula brevipes]|nr:hypothetical protein BC826DRAFT_1189330 [Russula brevipes]
MRLNPFVQCFQRVLENVDDALHSAARMGDECQRNQLVDEKGDEERPVRGIIYAIAHEQPSPMIVVDFIVFKTLPDPKPIIRCTVVPLNFNEVLWNFSRFNDNRRITLQDNPHFYLELPTSVDAYTSEFRTLPVQDMQLISNSTIYVLVD